MPTTVTIDDATLHLADCRELLTALDPVDVVITDPPYDEKTHRGARTQSRLDRSPIGFPAFGEADFLDFSRQCVESARRWVVLSCAWQHAARLEQGGLPLIRLGAWVKPNGAPQFSGDRPATGWEAVAILHRPGKKRWNGGGRHAVWTVARTEGEHPTQKPLPLLIDWVRLFSDANETILDPCMGSGTTGVACARLGRRFIGIEIRPDYFDLACRRLRQAHAQPRLFTDLPSTQPRLFS